MESTSGASAIQFAYKGRAVRVTKNANWPKDKLWIDIDGQRDYLGKLSEGMTRAEVKQLAVRWLAAKFESASPKASLRWLRSNEPH